MKGKTQQAAAAASDMSERSVMGICLELCLGATAQTGLYSPETSASEPEHIQ